MSCVHKNVLYMPKYFKKGHNYVKKGQIKRIQPLPMGDNPRRFQDHPLKTLGVGFARI